MASLLILRHSSTPGWIDVVPGTYDQAGRNILSSMPGIAWVRDSRALNGRGYYQGPEDAVTIAIDVLESTKIAKIKWEKEVEISTSIHSTPDLSCLPSRLFDYQKEGVKWLVGKLYEHGSALLTDEMGVGKSCQAIAAMDVAAPFDSIVIICPAVVESHWKKQIALWARDDNPLPGEVTPPRWYVYSYEKFQTALKGGSKKVAPLPTNISGCIVDEVHYTSNSKAQRSKAIVKFLESTTPRPYLIGLSGTPMTVRPRDLHNPLDILFPGRFGKWWNFTRRYCDGHWEDVPYLDKAKWVSDGASNLDELHQRLSNVMLRRTKKDVKLELPPKTRICVDVEIPKKALKSLQRAASAINWKNGGGDRFTSGGGDVLNTHISSLLSNIEEYKLDAAEALAKEIISVGSHPLILTTRKATAEDLGARLAAPVVTGEVDPGKRQDVLGNSDVGVATMYSVMTGIDLVNFDNIIYTGLDWVPSVLLQSEARSHRIGQLLPVTIHYLIGKGTLDEVVRERVIERLENFGILMGGGDESVLAGDLGGKDEDLMNELVLAAGQAGIFEIDNFNIDEE